MKSSSTLQARKSKSIPTRRSKSPRKSKTVRKSRTRRSHSASTFDKYYSQFMDKLDFILIAVSIIAYSMFASIDNKTFVQVCFSSILMYAALKNCSQWHQKVLFFVGITTLTFYAMPSVVMPQKHTRQEEQQPVESGGGGGVEVPQIGILLIVSVVFVISGIMFNSEADTSGIELLIVLAFLLFCIGFFYNKDRLSLFFHVVFYLMLTLVIVSGIYFYIYLPYKLWFLKVFPRVLIGISIAALNYALYTESNLHLMSAIMFMVFSMYVFFTLESKFDALKKNEASKSKAAAENKENKNITIQVPV